MTPEFEVSGVQGKPHRESARQNQGCVDRAVKEAGFARSERECGRMQNAEVAESEEEGAEEQNFARKKDPDAEASRLVLFIEPDPRLAQGVARRVHGLGTT